MSEDGWTEVKSRTKQSTKLSTKQSETPTTPRGRTNSANDLEVVEKGRMSRTAHRESKLEWSASKKRDREVRIEKRTIQRDKDRAAAKAAKE
jgi:hypothetical protein